MTLDSSSSHARTQSANRAEIEAHNARTADDRRIAPSAATNQCVDLANGSVQERSVGIPA